LKFWEAFFNIFSGTAEGFGEREKWSGERIDIAEISCRLRGSGSSRSPRHTKAD
jgi:hypothetical protein